MRVNCIVGAILAYLLLALTLYAQSVVLLAESCALGATVAGMAVRNTLLMLLLRTAHLFFPVSDFPSGPAQSQVPAGAPSSALPRL
jgi:uncharacterized membrane protein